MPSAQLLGFLEVVVRAGLIAVSAVAVAFSMGIVVALLVTRPKRVEVPATATAARPAETQSEPLPTFRPSAA